MRRQGSILAAQRRGTDTGRLVARIVLVLAAIVALIAAVSGPPRATTSGQPRGDHAIAVAQTAMPADRTDRLPAVATEEDLSQDTSGERAPLEDAVLASAQGVPAAVGFTAARHSRANHTVPGSATLSPPFEPPRA